MKNPIIKKNAQRKPYVNPKIRIHGLRGEGPIFSPKELKDIVDCVQNDAKTHPNRRTKETELKVLIMIRGLNPTELLNLNIEDLRKYSIIVKSFKSKIREVYLYDSLETKINEFVKKYRKGAKPNDPLFVSRHGNRTKHGTLNCTFNQRNKSGLGPRLGIEPLLPSMFKRTAIFQLKGFDIWDKSKKQLKAKVIRATLDDFMLTYCDPNLSKKRLRSLRRSLYHANDRGRVELPKPIGEKQKGAKTMYSVIGLILSWKEYQYQLPSLPNIDIRRTNIVLKEHKVS